MDSEADLSQIPWSAQQRIFRNPGMLGSMVPGMTRLASALAGGGNSYQQGYDSQMQLQSRLAQAMAAARMHDAAASKDEAETQAMQARPGMIDQALAASTGSTLPAVNAVKQYLQTGQMPQREFQGPPTEEGAGPGGVPLVDAATQSRISQAISRMLPVSMASKDINPEQYARSQQTYRGMDLGDQVLAGKRSAADVGRSQAAVEGKPLYHTDATGAVLDEFGGGLATDNPMAQSTIGLRGAQAGKETAQAGQARAAAAEHYAGAGEKGARTAQIKQETAQGIKTGSLQVITGDDGSVNIVNKATGQSQPVMAPGGKPLMGKGGTLNAEQANALTFANRMQAAQKTLDDMAAKGVYRQGNIKSMAETSASMIPFIGDKMAEAAGSLTNVTQSPEQQMVEQAQRDFVNAVLRRESGAAINAGEFTNAAKQYFDQPGDSKEVKLQKRTARQRVINGMMAAVPPNLRNIPDMSGAPPSVDLAANPGGRPPLDSFNR